MAEKFYGHSPAGLYGYSHLLGGYAGGQAEYVRVSFADVGPIEEDAPAGYKTFRDKKDNCIKVVLNP
ncbi:hypothetical protein [cf. Phormidesmis sp. LEGE 11477]|uniref:hypothetical protein n=1 Tax=cf. Phormidesmis sp. LEGE 11477 TaxID=1828680 RepID=UPI001D146364|nr:hypothetical protein [cf. Phormidesmis sp. LEGE 11477]